MGNDFDEVARVLGYSIVGTPLTGGSSTVYPAREDESGDAVARKVLAPGHDVARLEREARVLDKLDHPGLVKFRRLIRRDESMILVMDWVEGETLAAKMRGADPLSFSEANKLISQVADTLDVVHSKGVVHRDLSPANVMVESGQPGDLSLIHI